MTIAEILEKGGLTIGPLLFLSVLALSTIIERLWFWATVVTKEKELIEQILEAAREDWSTAPEIARRASDQPVGRFLYAPLRLRSPDPEVFRLALEASADDEIAAMRRGDKVLEAVIAMSPMLGLLGTVLGLINSLGSISIGELATSSTRGVTLGIGEALISTAVGLVIAIAAVAFYRIFQGLIFMQVKLFRRAGSELELLYRQYWSDAEEEYRPQMPQKNRPRSLKSDGSDAP